MDYALKLTVEPHTVEETDVIALREAGLSEAQILSVNLITSLFAFMTRLTNGLGVEHRHGRAEQMRRWLTGRAREYKWLFPDADPDVRVE